MFKENAVKALEDVVGKWSTVREELADEIKESIDESELDLSAYEVYDEGDCFGVWMESRDGDEADILINVENAGSTWYIAGVR